MFFSTYEQYINTLNCDKKLLTIHKEAAIIKTQQRNTIRANILRERAVVPMGQDPQQVEVAQGGCAPKVLL